MSFINSSSRLKLVLLLTFGSFLAACSAPAEPQQVAEEAAPEQAVSEDASNKIFSLPYTMETLDNGLRVVIVKTDYPDLVSLQIPVQTGSRNEVEPGKSGFAHFFEHMMFKGTKNFPQADYSSRLKNAGVDGNAYTSDDLTNYYISFPKEHLEEMLMLEADRFQNLHYEEAEFRTEALAVKGEYLKNSSSPYNKMLEAIRDLAFKDHTYKHTTMGFLRDIEAMPDQFEYSKTFFKRWYTPQYSTVIVVGDVDEQKTLDWVKKYWGVWEATDFKVEIPEEKPQTAQVYEHLEFAKSPNTYLAMAFRGPALDEESKNKPAIDLMSEAYFSQSSDLYKELVIQRQLVQAQFAYFPDRKDPQLLYILAQLKKPEYANEVKQAFVDTLVKARTELVDETRLNNIKSAVKYSFAGSLDSTGSIASTLASYVHYERDPEFLNRLYATFETITPEDIRTYTNEYFIDSNLTMMTMSPLAKLEDFDTTVNLDKAVAEAAAAPSADMPATEEVTENVTENVTEKNMAEAESADTMESMATPAEPASVARLFNQTSSDLVDVTWWFKTGAMQDPEGKKGLASLTSAMISNAGSASKTYTEIQQALYPLAAGFGSRVDKEMTVFRGNVHKDNLDAWYALVSEQLLNPGWREEDFQRVKDQLVNSIQNSLKSSNDEELGKEVLYEALYAGHSYSALSTGHVDDIEALTLDDVKGFYASQLTQANLTVAMAGNYPDAFASKLLADMSVLPKGEASDAAVAAAPALSGRHATIVEKDTMSTAVSFGFPIDVKRGDEDWVGLWLVRSWLGEHRNSNSFLYQRIRQERGMNYGDYAYIEYFPGGMFTSKPTINVPRSEQIFQVWIRPLRSITDAHFATRTAMWEMEKMIENGLTEEQFESTRNFLKNYVPQLVNSQGRILGYTVDSAFYGTDDFVGYVRNGLNELTVEKVNAIIKKHLQLENMHYVFITKDAEQLKKNLASDAESPMVYNSAKSDEILAEDKIISIYPLAIKEENIDVVPLKDVFK